MQSPWLHWCILIGPGASILYGHRLELESTSSPCGQCGRVAFTVRLLTVKNKGRCTRVLCAHGPASLVGGPAFHVQGFAMVQLTGVVVKM